MPATEDLDLLIAAARDAAVIALDQHGRDIAVTDKPGGAGPVTAADLAVDAMLRERLCAARPDYGWLSEETPDSPARLATQRQFIVDPIDGTRAFIDRSRDWAHSLAVAEAGRIVAAVVFLPMHDALFTALPGRGAQRNGAPIRVSDAPAAEAAEVLTTRPNMEPAHWAGGAVPGFRRGFRSSLAWRMCLVAEGRFDAMLTLRPTWEWDIAAGALILAEAGGRVSDPAGRGLRFNNAHPQVPGVVAGGPGVQADLLARLA